MTTANELQNQLKEAIDNDDIEALQTAINNGANFNGYIDEGGRQYVRVLIYALDGIIFGTEILKCLLENGATINPDPENQYGDNESEQLIFSSTGKFTDDIQNLLRTLGDQTIISAIYNYTTDLVYTEISATTIMQWQGRNELDDRCLE